MVLDPNNVAEAYILPSTLESVKTILVHYQRKSIVTSYPFNRLVEIDGTESSPLPEEIKSLCLARTSWLDPPQVDLIRRRF